MHKVKATISESQIYSGLARSTVVLSMRSHGQRVQRVTLMTGRQARRLGSGVRVPTVSTGQPRTRDVGDPASQQRGELPFSARAPLFGQPAARYCRLRGIQTLRQLSLASGGGCHCGVDVSVLVRGECRPLRRLPQLSAVLIHRRSHESHRNNVSSNSQPLRERKLSRSEWHLRRASKATLQIMPPLGLSCGGRR